MTEGQQGSWERRDTHGGSWRYVKQGRERSPVTLKPSRCTRPWWQKHHHHHKRWKKTPCGIVVSCFGSNPHQGSVGKKYGPRGSCGNCCSYWTIFTALSKIPHPALCAHIICLGGFTQIWTHLARYFHAYICNHVDLNQFNLFYHLLPAPPL